MVPLREVVAASAPAAPAAPVSPEEAKKNLSQALGTYFATRQKSLPGAEAPELELFQKGVSDVLKSGNKSYALGAQLASQLVHDSLEVTIDDLVAAFAAVMQGKEPLASPQQVNDEIQKLQAGLRQKQQEAAQKEAAANEAIGSEFLAKNRSAEGVQVTESGLQYKVIEPAKAADAKRPTADDSVVCHYRGTLLDGTEFDKSPENEPRTFGLKGVIKGWTEGITLMPWLMAPIPAQVAPSNLVKPSSSTSNWSASPRLHRPGPPWPQALAAHFKEKKPWLPLRRSPSK